MRVSYFHRGIVVPVESLAEWIAEYVGGHQARNIRGMEEMIQDIAQGSANEAKVSVRAVANLLIKPPYGGEMQAMRVAARARALA